MRIMFDILPGLLFQVCKQSPILVAVVKNYTLS